MPNEPSSTPARPVAVIVRFLMGLGAIAIAIGVFAVLKATSPKPLHAPVRQTALQVRVMTLQPVDVSRSWIGYGSARALRSAEVSAEVEGVIVDRPASIEPGLSVEFGDILVVIDPSDFLQRVAQLEQTIAAHRAELAGLGAEAESLERLLALAAESTALQVSEIERWRAANARSAGAPVELDRLTSELSRIQREEQTLRERLNLIPSRRLRIESQIAAEQASLAIAERNLERTRITTPLSGVIQSVSVDRGERVAPGATIARITDLTRIEIPLQVPVSAASGIRPGDIVELRAEGPVEAQWRGAVARVSPEADPANRTITVYVEIQQPADAHTPGQAPRLLPGTFVSGRVSSAAASEQIVVPRTAINRDTAMIVDPDGRVRTVPVTALHYLEATFPRLHSSETQWAVISSGLEPGQRIVLTNLDDLAPGMIVQPVETAAAEPTP